MKKTHSSTSFISGFLVFIIVLILLAAFCMMGYTQYQTNERIQNALDYIIDDYEISVESEITEKDENCPVDDVDKDNSNQVNHFHNA